MKRLLSADLPTPYFLAAAEIDRLYEDLKFASAASIGLIFVKISRVYYGVSRTRRLCAWWGKLLGMSRAWSVARGSWHVNDWPMPMVRYVVFSEMFDVRR